MSQEKSELEDLAMEMHANGYMLDLSVNGLVRRAIVFLTRQEEVEILSPQQTHPLKLQLMREVAKQMAEELNHPHLVEKYTKQYEGIGIEGLNLVG